MGVGERGRKRPRPARAFLMGASWSLLEMAKSVVFKCFFVQKNFPQSLAVTKSEDCLREINKLSSLCFVFILIQVFENVHNVGLLGHETVGFESLGNGRQQRLDLAKPFE